MRWADIDIGEQLWFCWLQQPGQPDCTPSRFSPLSIALCELKVRRFSQPTCSPPPGTVHPISGFSKAKTRLDAMGTSDGTNALVVAPWTIHDLRRTAATEMGRLGVSRFIIGKVLNHAYRSVTRNL